VLLPLLGLVLLPELELEPMLESLLLLVLSFFL
jgi:hypothetical protein